MRLWHAWVSLHKCSFMWNEKPDLECQCHFKDLNFSRHLLPSWHPWNEENIFVPIPKTNNQFQARSVTIHHVCCKYTYEKLASLQQLFNDNSNALVTQQAAQGSKMWHANELRVHAEDGVERSVQTLKHKDHKSAYTSIHQHTHQTPHHNTNL